VDAAVVSSAIYRYFPSRDALLTALIVDAYTDLGETATRAEGAAPRDDYRARFAALAHAVRGWALENRHRYALIYGSPVPGYAAPQDTVAPASMVSLLIASVFQDAVAAGHLPVVTPAMTASADLVEPLKRYFEIEAAGELVMVVIFAFTNLFGTVSFELFGHLNNTTGDPDRWFEIVIDELAGRLGL
jgi:AcrR family transcriptional regulator